MTVEVEKVFRARGAIARLFHAVERGLNGEPEAVPPTILIDGPAGTGKSRGVAEMIYRVVSQRACRVVFVRSTRHSLTQSTLATWEQEVVHPDDPMLQGARRSHRQSYVTATGAEIIPLGIRDDPDSTRSLQADLVWVEEATQLTSHEWQILYRILRTRDDPNQLPFKLLIGTTNPDGPGHHLYRRFMRGEITRWQSKHKDNPVLTEADIARLRTLRGVLFDRLAEGRWVAAEGAVLPNFDASVHMIELPRVLDGFEQTSVGALPRYGPVDLVALGAKRVIGAIDWGFTAPGAFGVAAVDGERRPTIIAQLYRTRMPLEWWVEEIAKLHRLYGIERIVADPSRPDCIDAVNRRLGAHHAPICIPADNQRTWTGKGDMAGIDLVRQMLEPRDDGIPGILIGQESLIGMDEELRQMGLPCSLEDEIPLLRYAPLKEGQRDKEQTDPGGADHAIDWLRYLCNHVRRLSPMSVTPIFKPNSAGDILGHAEELARIQAREGLGRWRDDD
ncbi:MAG: phage terminase large subunit [Solirubrobacterales bacterium]